LFYSFARKHDTWSLHVQGFKPSPSQKHMAARRGRQDAGHQTPTGSTHARADPQPDVGGMHITRVFHRDTGIFSILRIAQFPYDPAKPPLMLSGDALIQGYSPAVGSPLRSLQDSLVSIEALEGEQGMTRWAAAILAFATLSGCVNVQTMALKKGQGDLSTATKSVVLMAVEVSRSDESRYQPLPSILWVTDLNWEAREQTLRFQMTRKSDTTDVDGRTVYLTSIALSPGRYHFEGISGVAAAFPFVGQFFIPIVADFEVKPTRVSYVGHLKAVMRPRLEGEFRAGSSIPLIDQSATGMISHSWDVSIDNQSDGDLAMFRGQVPALAGISIDIDPLPAWDRAAAQRRWDGQEGDEKVVTPKAAGGGAD
jgi:hypothetical protein